ncbi:hypothetical protein Tco_1098200 [Tanacetum coccineum]
MIKVERVWGFVSYNDVLPPPTGLFLPPNLDLSNSGLEEFQQPEFEGYGPKTSKNVSKDASNKVKESTDASLVEELVLDDKLEKKTAFLAKIKFVRAKQQEKPVRKPVKHAEMYRPKAVNTARPNSAVVNTVRVNQVNVVKASACWVWRPTKLNSASTTLKKHNYVDARGRFQETCPISQASRNLIEDMLPLGEEQKEKKLLMCDKKNSVLFTDTACFVLSPDFKLADESQLIICGGMAWFKGVGFIDKLITNLNQDPRAWYETLSTYLLENGFRRGTIDKTLFIKKDKGDILLVQVKQKDDGISISKDKYVADILKKFDFVTLKTTSTPIETNKALLKDEEAEDVDVHLYRSMIGSLMYLTASRPNIMFAVCAFARFQVTPKVSHLHAVKRIFRYLKGQPKLGLWYPRDSPFDLEAFSDSDYAGASLDRKSTTGGCQFLGKRLISWQCKNQTIVANSTIEAEYVATANYCGQVLWIQNQMLDYGFNFMNTKIHIDNEGTVSSEILMRRGSFKFMWFEDGISNEFGVKTGSCKINAAKQDLVLLGEIEGEGLGQPSKPQPPPSTTPPSQEGQVSAVAPSHPQKTQIPRQAKRGWDTEIPQSGGPPEKVGDEAVHKELGDIVERATITAASLDAEHDSGGSLRCQKAMGGTIAQTRSERVPTSSYDSPLLGGNTPGSDEKRLEQHELKDNVSPTPYDSPLPGGHTPGSDEGRLQQDKLTNIVIALLQKVEGLESDLKKIKKLYATAFKKLINRVKSLEDELKFQKSKSKRRRLTLVTSEDEEDLVAEDPSKQGRSLIEEMDLDAGISLVPPHVEVQGRYGQNLETQEGFGDGQEVSIDAQVSTASTFVSTVSPQRNTYTIADDLTLVETLMEIRKSAAKDKGKAKMDETESPRKMKQRERVQISRDEEVDEKL